MPKFARRSALVISGLALLTATAISSSGVAVASSSSIGTTTVTYFGTNDSGSAGTVSTGGTLVDRSGSPATGGLSAGTTTVTYAGGNDPGPTGPALTGGVVGVVAQPGQATPNVTSFACPGIATVVINATYTDDVLDYTNTIYSTSLTCTATVMSEMDAIASFTYDGRGTGSAGYGFCSGACRLVSASQAWDCYDGPICSGTYEAFGNIDATLRSGYYWITKPSGCTGTKYVINCQFHSHVVTVSPVL
jgi:hypothetical protein